MGKEKYYYKYWISIKFNYIFFGIYFLEKFFDDVINSYNEDNLKIIYGPEDKDENNQIFINDFFIKYIVNCFLLNTKKIKNYDA